jgi:uncharacterized protein YciI
MKKYVFALWSVFLLAFTLNCFGQETATKERTNKIFDAKLAKKLGADDYGMKSYVFVILKTGKANITDKEKRDELFKGHFSNMGRLAKEGKLVLAGPLMDEKGIKRGLFILNVKTLEEAQKLIATDPTIRAGIFEVEMTKYYGSAALMQINEIHSKVQKKEM